VHTRIVLPNCEMYQKHRGVPSGSAFTALVDSIANYLILNYCWIRITGRSLTPDRCLVLGDDSIFGANTYVALERLATVATELGMVLGVGKSVVTGPNDAPSFLGHEWKQARPHRPKHDVLIRMVYPERWHPQSRATSCLRLYSYLSDCYESFEIVDEIWRHRSPYLHDVYQDLLASPREEGVTEPVSPPGRLRYLLGVEPEMLPTDVFRGYTLGAVGMLY
jgi:hypothetical protein